MPVMSSLETLATTLRKVVVQIVPEISLSRDFLLFFISDLTNATLARI